jgi:hypothetical protein
MISKTLTLFNVHDRAKLMSLLFLLRDLKIVTHVDWDDIYLPGERREFAHVWVRP